ncbi:Cell morphogenesis protein PAG1, partial [Rhizophlyctis rosea]
MEECGPELVRRHYHHPVLVSSTRSEQQKREQQQRQPQHYRVLSQKGSLVQLAMSESEQDDMIWMRCFPDLIRWCFEYASPRTIQLCLRDVCLRLASLWPSVSAAADVGGGVGGASGGKGDAGRGPGTVRERPGERKGSASVGSGFVVPLTEEVLDTWKLQLVFACACVEVEKLITGEGLMFQNGSTGRDDGTATWRSGYTSMMSSSGILGSASIAAVPFATPRQLYGYIIPLLMCDKAPIRQAAVTALGCVHWLSYQTLFEELQPYIRMVVDDIKTKGSHQRDAAGNRKEKEKPSSSSVNSGTTYHQQKRFERLRMELTHVLSLVADVVDHAAYRRNEGIMNNVMVYVTEMGRFLSDPETMFEWDHQMLRYYFCGFVERFYEHVVRACEGASAGARDKGDGGTPAGRRGGGGVYPPRLGQGYPPYGMVEETPERYMPFHIRLALFKLFEQWCGFGRYAQATREREAHMMSNVLENVKDIRERGVLTSAMEQQRKGVEVASLKAMAVLCKGAISRGGGDVGLVDKREKDRSQFEWVVLEEWIDSVFGSADESVHPIARSALESLLVWNKTNTQVLSDVIRKCYSGQGGSVIQMGYFMALVDCFVKEGGSGFVFDATPVYALALLKSGDPSLGVRRGAVRLLRVLEDRFWGREKGDGKYVF